MRLLGGLSPEEFMSQYWQKKPLLVRGAIPDFVPPVSRDELAGLALEDFVESRLVREDPPGRFRLTHGPMRKRMFSGLPPERWTLLVQDVDKHVPEAAKLLDLFSFIPRWRIDDLMISFAAPLGSVGPHLDRYDVFLLQAEGKRRWMIGDAPERQPVWAEDQDLKILERFAPVHDWVLEPGDMLYLPPGIAHHGVAETPCMTYSIGFRAPDYKDLLHEALYAALENLPEDDLYDDPDLEPTSEPGRIDEAALNRLAKGVRERFARADLPFTLARYLSRPKEHLMEERTTDSEWPTSAREVVKSESAIVLYVETQAGLTLFVNGEELQVAPEAHDLARSIANNRTVTLQTSPNAAETHLLSRLLDLKAIHS